MAGAVINACNGKKIKITSYLHEDFDWSNKNWGKPVAIHFGSGKQLNALIDTCEALWEHITIPIIQCSTKLPTPVPTGRNVVIINAPNAALPMIRLITAFPGFIEKIRAGMEIGIIESHQSTKADVSGTARMLAKLIGVPEDKIKSLRTHDMQLAFGVPQEHLGWHAYHKFILVGDGVKITLTTEIHGGNAYAQGALTLAEGLIKTPLNPGIHELKDVIDLI